MITRAVRSMRAMAFIVALPSSTCAIRSESWPSPTRQGHALSADLRVAEVQKVHRKVYRTQSRRTDGDVPLHVAVQSVDHGLRP